MRRFGYLEPNPSDSESLYHESAIIEAIKTIQKYGALNQTGELDNETLEVRQRLYICLYARETNVAADKLLCSTLNFKSLELYLRYRRWFFFYFIFIYFLKLFNKPRCGVPDIEGTPYYLTSSTQRSFVQSVRDKRRDSQRAEGESTKRHKRFVIGAPTWRKRRIRYL